MTQIIRANTSHAETLVKIGKTTFLEAHGHSASLEDIAAYVSKTYTKEAVLDELSDPENLYYILCYNNKFVGYSKIVLNTANINIANQNITKLDRIYLLKEAYGLNLGKILFDFNLHLSKERHQKGMWLAVWIENNRAIRFYTKTGFEIVGAYAFKLSKTHSNPNHIMYLEY